MVLDTPNGGPNVKGSPWFDFDGPRSLQYLHLQPNDIILALSSGVCRMRRASETSSSGNVMRTGSIQIVNSGGLAIVEDVNTHAQFPFKFGKIVEYKGENPREIGLIRGATVEFETSGNFVTRVEIKK